MANHAYVKTKKHMTFEAVDALLRKLNSEVFHDCLAIESWRGGDTVVNPAGWSFTVVDRKHLERVCWLNTRRTFEIRHGGGSAFIWWIDSVICQAIKDAFDGKWTDDGGPGVIQDRVPMTYQEYIKQAYAYSRTAYWITRMGQRVWVSDVYRVGEIRRRRAQKVVANGA